MTSASVQHVTVSKEGSDSDNMEEMNNFNLTEQQIIVVNAETLNAEKVYACFKEVSENSLDQCGVSDSLQPTCEYISTEFTKTDCDCASRVSVKQDDTEEANKYIEKAYENVQNAHLQGDFLTSTSSTEVDFAKLTPSKTKHVVITVTRIGPDVEEEVESVMTKAEEQAVKSSCLKDEDEEEGKSAEEDSEEAEEKRDVFPDVSIQLHQNHLSTKDTSLNISTTSSALANNPPPGSSVSRATFSPGSPTDKQIQLPALFNSLRGLRKVAPENNTVAQIKPGAKRAIFSEKQGDYKVQGSFLDQISQFLSREKKGDEKEEKKEIEDEGDLDQTGEKNENEESQEILETKEPEKDDDTEVSTESTKPPVSSAEAAFDAFKAFFTPKPLKKDPSVDKVDLEAVRKKIRTEKDALRSLFERTSSKTPEKKDSSDGKVCIMLSMESFKHILPKSLVNTVYSQ